MSDRHLTTQQLLADITTQFPHDFVLVEHVLEACEWLNARQTFSQPLDLETIRVLKLWLLRVLRKAERGQVDAPGVMGLSRAVRRWLSPQHRVGLAELERMWHRERLPRLFEDQPRQRWGWTGFPD